MASTNASFKVVTRSPKQATALIDSINDRADNSDTFEAAATRKGASVVVDGTMTYAKAAVGPGHIKRTIETATRSAGVEVRSIERVNV